MNPKFASYLVTILLLLSAGVQASPEEDRTILLDHYKKIFPTIKVDDYVYGALALNKETKEQYDDMMDFPSFAIEVRQGGIKWETPFKNGNKYSSCYKYGGINAASGYPLYDDAAEKVLTFENSINSCLKANNENEIAYGSRDMALLTAYAKSLSDNAKVNIKVKGPCALAAYEKGKQLYFKRRGQLNFACATCHIDNPGKFTRSEQLSMMIGHASHWPEFRAGTEALTLQGRFIQCQKNTRTEPSEFNSTDYNNLEYYMTYMSNGLMMKTPVFRKQHKKLLYSPIFTQNERF
jgi:sulfur-oxidizing protein SoxA